MTKQPHRETVISFIAEEAGLSETDIHPNSVLRDIIDDSLELAYFLLSIEEEFHVILKDEEIEKMITVNDILERLAVPN